LLLAVAAWLAYIVLAREAGSGGETIVVDVAVAGIEGAAFLGSLVAQKIITLAAD
jgi:hypothetical protein